MRAVFLTSILALALSYLLSPAGLAHAEQDTPESVAKAYIAATQGVDWAKAASFVHPDSLNQFKEMFAPIFANEKAAPDEQKSGAAPRKAPSTRTKARKPARRP